MFILKPNFFILTMDRTSDENVSKNEIEYCLIFNPPSTHSIPSPFKKEKEAHMERVKMRQC